MIPFGEYLPDLPDLQNPGATIAKNVFPAIRSYTPWPSYSAFANALDAYCRGFSYVTDKSGNSYNFAGDVNKLYSLANDTFSDVSKAGSPAYSLATEETWEFAKFGETLVACSGVNGAATNNIQAITLGGANFADLSGSPPQARHIATVRDFVVVGNTWDSTDGLVPNRVRWSGFGDETTWAVSAATQADLQDLYSAVPNVGGVQRIIGGEYGIVFQERSIWRMSYVGSPLVWQFDEILPGTGTPCPGSVVRKGNKIYFISQDGFDVIINGSQHQHIGANKIDETFYDDFDSTYWYRVSAAQDTNSHRIFWAYPGEANSGGCPNKVICYDEESNRFTTSDQDIELITIAATGGYTLDGLDSVSSSLDALTESLDSRVWQAGQQEIAVFDENNKLGFWSGANLAGTVETTEAEINQGARTMLTAIRPAVDGGTTTVQVGTRNRQQDAYSWTPASSINANGEATLRKTARYHRIRCNLSGDFEHAQGIDVDSRFAGRR